MRFKIDENLPAEAAEILKTAGFDAHKVADEDLAGAHDETVAGASRSEDRILLGLDFADIRADPPGERRYRGIRVKHQDKVTVLIHLRRLIMAPARRNPRGELWIVDGNRIRFRQGS